MFGSFGWMELLLILIIVLIIFGAGKIPQLGEGLGKAIKGFKKSVQEPDPAEPLATSTGAEEPAGKPQDGSSEATESETKQTRLEKSEQTSFNPNAPHPTKLPSSEN